MMLGEFVPGARFRLVLVNEEVHWFQFMVIVHHCLVGITFTDNSNKSGPPDWAQSNAVPMTYPLTSIVYAEWRGDADHDLMDGKAGDGPS